MTFEIVVSGSKTTLTNKPFCSQSALGLFVSKPMAKSDLIDEEYVIMDFLRDKYAEVFYAMLGRLIVSGMDIRTAVWDCWNKLECGGKNG